MPIFVEMSMADNGSMANLYNKADNEGKGGLEAHSNVNWLTTASVILGPNRTANRSGGQYGAFAIAWVDSEFGYRKKFGDVLVKTKPDSQLDNMAANINATYTKDSLKAEAGFRFRGAQASMMYVKQADSETEITDNLGDCNKLRPWVDVSSNVVDGVKLGVKTVKEFDADNVKSLSVVYGYDNAKSENYQMHRLQLVFLGISKGKGDYIQ